MKKTTEALARSRELSGNSEQVEPVVDHIEDVRGRSMADAAVGPCDCDPHIEHCPSCAPYLHEPLKPAGEEDKATYKQIADNYTHPANCPRCAELEERDLQLRNLLCVIHRDGGHHTQAHGLEQSIEDAKEKFFDLRDLPDTIAQQAERIKELETIRGNGVLVPGPELKKMQEQLAAAEKLLIECRSSVRLDWQNYERLLMNNNLTGSREAITDEAKRLHELLLAIDAAIAAQKEWK